MERIPTFAREVFDVSGAGDTVIAALTLALAAGFPLPPGVEIELSPLAGDSAAELAAYLAEHPVREAW